MKIDKKEFWQTIKDIGMGMGIIFLFLVGMSILFLTYQVIKVLYF